MNFNLQITSIVALSAFLILFFSSASAQDNTSSDSSKWDLSGSTNVSFSNVGLSRWSGGGESTISVGLILDLGAKRETEKSVWTNQARFAFGMARVGDAETNLFKKTDDLLHLNSTYGYKFNNYWSVSASSDFSSQVAPGYTFIVDAEGKEQQDQLISEFMAPAFWMNSFGIQYADKIVRATFSPISSKTTFVMNDSMAARGDFGVDPGQNVRFEVGAALEAALTLELMKNVNFKSRANIFMNYGTPDLIDINWETLLVLKVNKYIHTSFGTHLIYDHDVRLLNPETGRQESGIQFKHVLNVNFGYTF